MEILLQNEVLTISRDEHEGIPFVIYRPTGMSYDRWPTVFFYHGWSSSKEKQHLRGHILATMGYQVIMPDALHHGERGILDYERKEVVQNHFWTCVEQSIKEFPGLLDYATDFYHADREQIAVSGHSMGGITSAGIFVHNQDVATVVAMNGGFNWKGMVETYKENLDPDLVDTLDLGVEEPEDLDPMNNLEKLQGRPILSIHGVEDPIVPCEPDYSFQNHALDHYEFTRKDSVVVSVHEGTGHVVTTNMMDEALLWLNMYLG